MRLGSSFVLDFPRALSHNLEGGLAAGSRAHSPKPARWTER